jgi:hypothetical protein
MKPSADTPAADIPELHLKKLAHFLSYQARYPLASKCHIEYPQESNIWLQIDWFQEQTLRVDSPDADVSSGRATANKRPSLLVKSSTTLPPRPLILSTLCPALCRNIAATGSCPVHAAGAPCTWPQLYQQHSKQMEVGIYIQHSCMYSSKWDTI